MTDVVICQESYQECLLSVRYRCAEVVRGLLPVCGCAMLCGTCLQRAVMLHCHAAVRRMQFTDKHFDEG